MRREVYWFILARLILFENLALVSRLVSPCSVWFWSVWVQDWVQEQVAGVVLARILALLDYLRAMQLFQPAIPTRGTKVPAFVSKVERHAASDMQ